VLCFETAFLALENGDTLGTGSDSGNVVTTSVEETETKTISKVKCFPNPFTNSMTIESPDDIDMLEIFDITGRLVFSQKDLRTKTFVWNGQSTTGQNLNAGIYIIRIKHKESIDTLKVQKM
jgi:flagellar hook assembly protein FlgD